MLETQQSLLVVSWEGEFTFAVDVVPFESDAVEAETIVLRHGILSSKVVDKVIERQFIGEFNPEIIDDEGELNGVAAVGEEARSEFSREVAAECQVRHKIVVCNFAGLWQAIHGFHNFAVYHFVAHFVLKVIVFYNVGWEKGEGYHKVL